MSISYNASVIWGFRLNTSMLTGEKTQYDIDTGKPYKIQVDICEITEIEGIRIADAKDNPDRFCVGEKIEELKIFQSGYEKGTKMLGVELAVVSENNNFKEIQLTKQPLVDAFAKKYGITPNLCLILCCG